MIYRGRFHISIESKLSSMKAIKLLLFIPFLIACSTYEPLSIEVLQPAKYSFQPEIKSVVLVDNSMAFRSKGVHHISLPDESYSVDTIWKDDFPLLVLDGLKNELTQRNFFDTVYVHDISLRRAGVSDSSLLSWNRIDQLCKKYNAEAVISIEGYTYHTNIKVENMYDGNMYGYLDAGSTIFYRAYNHIDHSFILEELLQDTISWSVYGNGLNYIAQNLPTLRTALDELAGYMGVRMADDIAPHWAKESRVFYNSGNVYFMQATDYVRNNQWGDAIKLWKFVYEHSKKKVKARAAYNLALASEIQGDYESSLYWIRDGLNIVSKLSSGQAKEEKKRLALYSSYMAQRFKVLDDLKNQVGGGE